MGLLIVLAGATLMALLGAMDDIRGLEPRTRFGSGLLISGTTAACALFTAGYTGPMTILGVLLLTLWLAGSSNAMNMLDGLDGLAAGVTAIAAAAIGTIALLAHNHTCVVLAFSLAGACAGFLRYNFRPASTFMGDVGSLFLGFTLASLVLLLLRGVGESRSIASVVVAAMLATGVPIGDMVLAMVRRFLNHKPLFQGDRSHSYDQLRDRFGFSVVKTVLICYLAGLLLGAVAVGISLQSPWSAVAATLIVIMALAAILIRGGFLYIPPTDSSRSAY
ncbi:MAG: undecaprenyl/decaprenyl-phosphate alpha-N-acetylglucosaminyl 1-phosphate transferase [Armatimonadetes bacterium]|nr:undecaprenyl/decaprenyl-phosphate alpha-N-acetylglucosaminyl 1-phosphate transferase [Armatimonadota bacterium]